ncbi:uroporphyrinogen decarboxylase/cobalamine-independent methonine synthase family protein [Stetteria hydrogenophila]
MGVVWGFVVAGYPRPRHVRLALRDRERGVIPFGAAEESIALGAASVIGAQVSAGLAFAGDGCMDWHDVLRPFAVSWRNVSLGGLLRFFDNNFFYRIPVFHGEPEPSDVLVPPRVRRFHPVAWPAGFKATIPGPFTFLKLSKNEAGVEDEELGKAIAKVLAVEVKGAVEAGAGLVEVQEPFLADVDAKPEDAELLDELLKPIREASAGAKLVVSIYYNFPDRKVYEKLLDVKADYVALDFGDAPSRAYDTLQSLGRGQWTPAFGEINGREIYDDDIERLASRIASAAKTLSLEEVVVTTTSGFELIPYRYSLRKTALLGRLAERVAEELGFELKTPLRHV